MQRSEVAAVSGCGKKWTGGATSTRVVFPVKILQKLALAPD